LLQQKQLPMDRKPKRGNGFSRHARNGKIG
jgi:hypothetical protein